MLTIIIIRRIKGSLKDFKVTSNKISLARKLTDSNEEGWIRARKPENKERKKNSISKKLSLK